MLSSSSQGKQTQQMAPFALHDKSTKRAAMKTCKSKMLAHIILSLPFVPLQIQIPSTQFPILRDEKTHSLKSKLSKDAPTAVLFGDVPFCLPQSDPAKRRATCCERIHLFLLNQMHNLHTIQSSSSPSPAVSSLDHSFPPSFHFPHRTSLPRHLSILECRSCDASERYALHFNSHIMT